MHELKDGVYLVGNDVLEWQLCITNGVFNSYKLVNKKSGEILLLNGTDFLIKLGYSKNIGWIKRKGKTVAHGASKIHTIIPENCIPIKMWKGKSKASFYFIYKPLDVIFRIDYLFFKNENLIHRKIVLENHNENELIIEELSLGNWKVDRNISGGGKGLPVFIDNIWFASGETPWFTTTIDSNTFSLCHYPSVYIKKGELWSSDSALIGGGIIDARNTFYNYIKNVILPPKFITLYNTWYDLRKNDLNVSKITNNFIQLSNRLNEFNAEIDYCVIDDGWFFKNTLYSTNTNYFPNGLIEVSRRIKPLNSNLGLWLSFSGLQLDNKELKNFNYEEAHTKYFCLSGTNYYSALSSRLSNLIKNDHIRFFKHDFNFFACTKPNHGHLRNIIHSEETNMRQTANLLDEERNICKEVVQAITTGINLSPWWLKHANFLFMGGGDIEYDKSFPASSHSGEEMNSRDGRLYKTLVENQIFFPLYALMTHGIIDGELNSVGPWLNDDQWSDYIMNYLGRGTSIRELYLFYDNLNKTKSESLARGLNWAKKHEKMMLDSKMILGDPRKNELYGFRGIDVYGNVYISLRNPCFNDKLISISDLGITSEYYCISYPYYKVCESKRITDILIPAESVIIVESLKLTDLKIPTVINVRSKISSSDNDNVGIDISFDNIRSVPIYLFSPNKINIISDVGVKKIGNNLWELNFYDQTNNLDSTGIIIDKINIDTNGFDFLVDISDNSSVDLFFTLKDKNVNINFKDNEFSIPSKNVFSNEGFRWKVNVITLTNGTHRIFGSFSNEIPDKNLIKIQARIKYKLNIEKILISNKHLNAIDLETSNNNSQFLLKKTINIY